MEVEQGADQQGYVCYLHTTLKHTDGQFITDPREQADLLARTFEKKCKLPEATKAIVFEAPIAELSDFVLVRTRWVLKVLKAIDVDNATGPDLLSGRIL